jgi:hypothetical protein
VSRVEMPMAKAMGTPMDSKTKKLSTKIITSINSIMLYFNRPGTGFVHEEENAKSESHAYLPLLALYFSGFWFFKKVCKAVVDNEQAAERNSYIHIAEWNI